MDKNITAATRYSVGKGSSLAISLKDTTILDRKKEVYKSIYNVLYDEDGQIGKKVALKTLEQFHRFFKTSDVGS
jgi:hypothetical protein